MTSTTPVAPSSTTTQRVSSKTVQQAVKSLLKWRKSKSRNQKPKLFDQDDEEFFYLILTLKKIPAKGRVRANPHKILLPRSLFCESSESCLIIDSRSKSNLTKEAALKKIKAENVPVSEVLTLSKLKSDFRPFEAKRKLCDSYNMFFADKRIIPLLPGLLGNHFYKNKKIPVPVDLTHKNWKEQIERSYSSALLFLRTGTCSVVKVGKFSMDKSEIVENVIAAIDGIAEVVPKNWANVRCFHLKLLESLALPIYQTVPDLKLKIEGAKEEEERVKKDEIKEMNGYEAKKGGNCGKKGEIQEVRYMDYNVDDIVDEDEFGSDDEGDNEEGENKEWALGRVRKAVLR